MNFRLSSILLIIQLLCLNSTVAQSLQVTISFSDQYSPSGTSVQILDSAKQDLIDFCIIEESGICRFDGLKKKKTYQLHARYFGYQDTIHYFSLNENENLELHFILNPTTYDLPDISVVDKIIGFKKRGDTLEYNIRAYSSGTEQSLGDLLETLPGIEIDTDGDVKVRNKKVDALLIEGKELVNSQHQLATEGIQSDVVESIELIENYKTHKGVFEDEEQTLKVAVNIKLKEEAKGNWNGNLELFGGVQNNLNSAVNLFKTTQKKGWSVFLRQNNVGEEPIEKPTSIILEDLFAQNSIEILRLKQLNYSQDNMLSAGVKEGVIENEDYHFSINGDVNLNPKAKNKTYMTGSYANRTAQKKFERNYFNNDISENGTERHISSFPFLYMRNRTDVQWNESNYTQLTLPFQFLSKEEQTTEMGVFDRNDFFQVVDREQQTMIFKPKIEHIIKLENNLRTTVSQEFSFQNIKSRIEINADDPFLDLIDIMGTENFRLSQHFDREAIKSSTQLELKKRWGRDYIQWIAEYKDESEQLDVTDAGSQNPSQNNEQQLRTKVIQYGLKATKVFKKGRILASLNQAFFWQIFDSANKLKRHFILPYALFYYEYFKEHAFSILFSKDIQYSGLDEYYTFPQILGARTIARGALGLEGIRESQNYSLSFFKTPRASGLKYSLQFSYAKIDKSFIVNSTSRTDYIENNYLLIPEVNQYSTKIWLNHSFDKWRLSFDCFISYSESFASRVGALFPLNNLQSNSSLNLKSQRWKGWDVDLSLTYYYIQQTQSNFKNIFSAYDITSKVKYTIKKWNMTLGFTQRIQSNKNVNNNNLTIVDFHTTYRLNRDWKLFIKMTNILNMEPKQLIDSDFNSSFNQLTTYQTFPGQIMLGIGYYF